MNNEFEREQYNLLFPIMQEIVKSLGWVENWKVCEFINRIPYCQEWLDDFILAHLSDLKLKTYNYKAELKKYLQSKRNYINESEWNVSMQEQREIYQKDNEVSEINNDPNSSDDFQFQDLSESFAKDVFTKFLNKSHHNDDEKIKIISQFTQELNYNSTYQTIPSKNIPAANWRLFKRFYAKNYITFSTKKDVLNYIKQNKEDIPVASVKSDQMIFEQECRKVGINNEISIWNLYFNLKQDDIFNGVIQCHDVFQIRTFLDKNFYMFKKYELKKKNISNGRQKQTSKINFSKFLNN